MAWRARRRRMAADADDAGDPAVLDLISDQGLRVDGHSQSNEGFLNQFLLWTGLISTPLTILNTNAAVYIGIVYTYLPFMILPIYSALERMDGSLIEAAEDLGCSRLQAFWLVTIPLSRPGIIAGCFLVFS